MLKNLKETFLVSETCIECRSKNITKDIKLLKEHLWIQNGISRMNVKMNEQRTSTHEHVLLLTHS